MWEMTDLHSHALCCVDDGAKDIEQMKKMIDIAHEDGITSICFTPHFKMHHFDSDDAIHLYNKKIEQSFNIACEYVSSTYPDMHLFLGNEIMYHHDIYESISQKRCLKLGNSSYSLVEFVPDTPFFEIRNALSNLIRKGVRPILAHAERYVDLVKDIKRVKELKEIGILIQINASSITRLKLGKSARFVKKLFKLFLVDLIATDAHDSENFKPIMSSAVSIIERKYGEKVAKRVSQTTPNFILENKIIH